MLSLFSVLSWTKRVTSFSRSLASWSKDTGTGSHFIEIPADYKLVEETSRDTWTSVSLDSYVTTAKVLLCAELIHTETRSS